MIIVLKPNSTPQEIDHILDRIDSFVEPIQQAGPFPQCGPAIRNTAAFAEQALEHDARMRFGRQRRRGRRPREVVLINAGVAVVALTDQLKEIHRQFQ